MASREVREWLRKNECRSGSRRVGRKPYLPGIATGDAVEAAELYGMKGKRRPDSKVPFAPKAIKVNRHLHYQGNGVWV